VPLDGFADPVALRSRLLDDLTAAGALATTPALITAWSRV